MGACSLKIADLVGKRVSVHTQNTRYQFDIFAIDDIHGEAFDLRGSDTTRYLDGRISDVEIKGCKVYRYPWHSLGEKYAKAGHLFEGGFLYFRYPGQSDYVTTSRIERIDVRPLPENPLSASSSKPLGVS